MVYLNTCSKCVGEVSILFTRFYVFGFSAVCLRCVAFQLVLCYIIFSSVCAHLHLDFTILGYVFYLGDTESFQDVTSGTYLNSYVYEVGFGFFWQIILCRELYVEGRKIPFLVAGFCEQLAYAMWLNLLQK